MHCIGIEIGGTKLQIVTGTAEGCIQERRRFKVARELGAAGIRDQIQETVASLAAEKPAAIGIGFGGPVDWQRGRICRSHQIEGWSEFDIRGWLEPLACCPIFVENDANVAALGEADCGAGVGITPVFYITLGSGVGGGLVVDGQIYHGRSPGEAEIGHVRLDKAGAIVESRCSGWAVDVRIRDACQRSPGSHLTRLCSGTVGGEASHLASALEAGDAIAEKILGEVCDDLAFALSHVMHLFHPNVVILGGGLSLVGEPLRAGVSRALPRYVMDAFHPTSEVVLAKLGENAVPIGALRLAARNLEGFAARPGKAQFG